MLFRSLHNKQYPNVKTKARKALIDYNGFMADGKIDFGSVKHGSHKVTVDIKIFRKATFPVPGRSTRDPFGKPYLPNIRDFRLQAGAVAVDKGKVLFNINDGYAGKSPDLGCYELGRKPVHYGPRVGADRDKAALFLLGNSE